jgi:DNA-directed RNA polymerase subunit RPC12/RpoP
MHRDKDKYVLQCRECGSRVLEIHGPAMTNAVVECASCHAEIGSLDEFLAFAEERIEGDQERRNRRFH